MHYKNNLSLRLSHLLFVILLVSFFACKDKKTSKPEDKTEEIADTPGSNNQPDYRLGSFVGAFGDNKITLLIISIKGDSVLGS